MNKPTQLQNRRLFKQAFDLLEKADHLLQSARQKHLLEEARRKEHSEGVKNKAA